MSSESIVILAISVALAAYLLYALLRAEKL